VPVFRTRPADVSQADERFETICTRRDPVQVIAKGDGGESAAGSIVRQCAVLRGVIPVLALPSCIGPMAVDGSMTDWALRTVRSLPMLSAVQSLLCHSCVTQGVNLECDKSD
jgi:hypothetical protein